jgi:hypothetical protein
MISARVPESRKIAARKLMRTLAFRPQFQPFVPGKEASDV